MKQIKRAIFEYLFKTELADMRSAKQENESLKRANNAIVKYVLATVRLYKKEHESNTRVLIMCQEIDNALTWQNKELNGLITVEQIKHIEKHLDKDILKMATELERLRNESLKRETKKYETKTN
jgi:hypothetical protein